MKCIKWKVDQKYVSVHHYFQTIQLQVDTKLISISMVCVCSVAQLCATLYDLMDCRPPGASVHGIFQARILEQFSLAPPEISPTQGQTHVSYISCIGRQILYHQCYLGSPQVIMNVYQISHSYPDQKKKKKQEKKSNQMKWKLVTINFQSYKNAPLRKT